MRSEVIKKFQTSVWTIYTRFTNLSRTQKLQYGIILRV